MDVRSDSISDSFTLVFYEHSILDKITISKLYMMKRYIYSNINDSFYNLAEKHWTFKSQLDNLLNE